MGRTLRAAGCEAVVNRMAARSGGIRAEPGRVEGSGAPLRAARETLMDEIAIRTATLDDLETIVDFNARLADESEGMTAHLFYTGGHGDGYDT